jgi:hypothetical protein
MASTKLTRTMGTQGSSIKGTFSAWVKRNKISLGASGVDSDIYQHNFSSDYRFFITFTSNDILRVADYRNGWIMRQDLNRTFRDTNAWYHIYVAIDRSLASGGDRTKIYINGVRDESFSSSTDYDQQTSGGHTGSHSMNNDYNTIIGGRENTTDYFDGSISHLYWVDGSVIDVSEFGETDSTTGEWKIKTNPTIASYGTNGHSHFKDVASVNDASPNSNNFTLSTGTLTKTEDCPSNVFATLNPLRNFSSMGSFSNGNNTYTKGDNGWVSALSTLGITSGKYYYEAKWVSGSYFKMGFCTDNGVSSIGHIAEANLPSGFAWYQNSNGEVRTDGSVVTNWSSSDITNITSISTGDIMKIAVDLDNKYAYFGVNNVWAKNADPTSGASGTGGLDISSDFPSGTILFPAISVYNSVANVNFGNGYFGTTAVSSAGTNASGIGIFEYDVPTGYTALSTKGLNL